jgi:hypothetical protein
MLEEEDAELSRSQIEIAALESYLQEFLLPKN